MGQLIRMNSAFGWLGLICLQLVQGAEGSVGQNIQYPQVCAPNYASYAFISRIFGLRTPSRFHQHKGLFLRSASFMGIVCIVRAKTPGK